MGQALRYSFAGEFVLNDNKEAGKKLPLRSLTRLNAVLVRRLFHGPACLREMCWLKTLWLSLRPPMRLKMSASQEPTWSLSKSHIG